MGWVHGKISEYTDSSRMRRAMSCVYWPPKSRMAIRSMSPLALSHPEDLRSPESGPAASAEQPGLARRAQLLGALEDLALRLDRRRDDQLGLLQLADVAGPDRAHAGADGADEVQRAVLGERGPEQDLLERPGHADADPRAARQVRVRRRHAPVVAAARRLLGARERRADHD